MRMADCHPDRPHLAKGMCGACYQRAQYVQRQTVRMATCSDCGVEFQSGKRGRLAALCADCKYARSIDAAKAWKDRNPDAIVAYRQAYYADNANREAARKRYVLRYAAADPAARAASRRRLYEERQRPTAAAKMADWRQRNPGKHAEIENRRRARKLAQFVAPVDPAVIRERSGGKCGICGKSVALADQSLDHITPLARGGTHEPANVQLARRSCNSRKGAKLNYAA